MGQPDLATRLKQAISLINEGRRADARAILIPLSRQYPNTEQVWMWLASAAESNEERVDYLEQVLRLNPGNERARSAYTKLTGRAPASSTRVASTGRRGGTRAFETYLVAALALAAVIFVVVLISMFVGPALAPKIPTETLIPSLTYTASMTFTPSITPGGPTLTPIMALTLPPTWTPADTDTPEATRTPPPSVTPLPTYTRTPTFRASLTAVPTITPGGPTITVIFRTSTPTLTVPPESPTPAETVAPTATAG